MFMSICLKCYGLDPCHYLSSPGLSWDTMLKMTEVELELISEIAMYLFIEKDLIAKRFSKANNKYMKSYDNKSSSKYMMYLDANNLCGWAMSQYLPCCEFKWLIEKKLISSV